MPIYRITKNDILTLNIVTTPQGDAAQFYSALNASSANGGQAGGAGGGSMNVSSDVNVFGIGYIKAEGRTIEDMTKEIQEKVNDNFVQGKSEVRLNTDGITYYILGDVETVGISGEKKAHKNTLTLTEALAVNGGLNRTVDRSNVVIHRKLPEGIKIAKIDLTREDAMNSPYYWVQNGDEIFLNTRSKNLNGFGKDPIQTLTTGVSLVTTAMTIYLLLTRL